MTDTTSSEKKDSFASKSKPNSATTTAFEPQPNWTLLSQGAEARIWKIPAVDAAATASGDGEDVAPAKIVKERFSKSYRHPILDEKLTKSRCKAEGRILEKCRNQDTDGDGDGIDVPQVLRTEPPILYLEFIEGMTVREYLEEYILCDDQTQAATTKKLQQLARQIGTMIGKLHKIGCIHGDLTTSNMMLRETPASSRKRIKPNEEQSEKELPIVLIDFGLAKNTTSAEERAVDLYVLERALTSTHPKLPQSFLETLLEAYKTSVPLPKAFETIKRLEQVRLRGRKRECFG